MYAISIDLGISTGIAVFENSELVYVRTMLMPHIVSLLGKIAFDVVILERMPGAMAKEIASYYSRIDSTEETVLVKISPGEWKPLAQARRWRLNCRKTLHEQDAYNMYRYWYRTTRHIDIGEQTCKELQF